MISNIFIPIALRTNVYDMRLTAHADGWIYGVFCTERKDPQAAPGRSEAAAPVATALPVAWSGALPLRGGAPSPFAPELGAGTARASGLTG